MRLKAVTSEGLRLEMLWKILFSQSDTSSAQQSGNWSASMLGSQILSRHSYRAFLSCSKPTDWLEVRVAFCTTVSCLNRLVTSPSVFKWFDQNWRRIACGQTMSSRLILLQNYGPRGLQFICRNRHFITPFFHWYVCEETFEWISEEWSENAWESARLSAFRAMTSELGERS